MEELTPEEKSILQAIIMVQLSNPQIHFDEEHADYRKKLQVLYQKLKP